MHLESLEWYQAQKVVVWCAGVVHQTIKLITRNMKPLNSTASMASKHNLLRTCKYRLACPKHINRRYSRRAGSITKPVLYEL